MEIHLAVSPKSKVTEKGKQPITWVGNKLGKGAGALRTFPMQPSHITSPTKVDLFGSIVSTMSILILKIKKVL